ncbi:MAG: UDP-N-acetylmuramoyl-L-alanine--D-glutamate ligase [Acidobacteria bacterium]|nr:UDP-N-acetylmuramoyl-L-alanine--D-glutamate ligase [Acidobacteriota bacterium]
MGNTEFSVRGRRVVVVGAARSGIAAAELLAKRGARVMLTEQRPAFDGADHLRATGVEIEAGGHKEATLESADLIVASPGVPLENPVFDGARRRGVEMIGELELASRWLRGRVIAITGTKGKSTTTTLVGRMLTAAGYPVLVGGNIGIPLSSQVEASTPETVHVVEASSFQLETTNTFRPWIALWLNLADDHFDRHAGVDAYVSAKARVFANQTANDWAVLNADDEVVSAQGAHTAAQRVYFSLADHTQTGFVVDGDWIVQRTPTSVDRLLPVSAVELAGRHMLNNVLAATAVASIASVPSSAMVEALRGFHGLPHVMEPVATIGGVRFVNDSKATNVEAARRSIESFPAGVVAIVGGHFKGGDLRDLREPLSQRGAAVVAIGTATPLVHAALDGVVPVLDAGSMREAVDRAYEAARPQGVVLLAPACASFDWFRDYAERGESFKAEVARLVQSRGAGPREPRSEE